jgi:hypothetical protein
MAAKPSDMKVDPMMLDPLLGDPYMYSPLYGNPWNRPVGTGSCGLGSSMSEERYYAYLIARSRARQMLGKGEVKGEAQVSVEQKADMQAKAKSLCEKEIADRLTKQRPATHEGSEAGTV